jgi:hypothetical protein
VLHATPTNVNSNQTVLVCNTEQALVLMKESFIETMLAMSRIAPDVISSPLVWNLSQLPIKSQTSGRVVEIARNLKQVQSFSCLQLFHKKKKGVNLAAL